MVSLTKGSNGGCHKILRSTSPPSLLLLISLTHRVEPPISQNLPVHRGGQQLQYTYTYETIGGGSRVAVKDCCRCRGIASFPGSAPPRAQLLRVTFEPVQRNRPGSKYHANCVTGRGLDCSFPDPSHMGKGLVRGGCARRNNYVTCAIISIFAHATQFNPLSQHLSIFVRFVSAVTLTCGILAAVRRFSAG